MNQRFLPEDSREGHVRTWLRETATRALAPWADRSEPLGRNVFGILTFHRVCSIDSRWGKPTFNVSPQRLREQLSGLLKRGYSAWPLSRVLDHCLRGLAIPRRTFVVTFDDGYANNVTQALSILQELSVPATMFLATGYLDATEPFPFDHWQPKVRRQECREAWIPLTRDQCHVALATGLIELGCHTHTHQVFRQRPEEFQQDLSTSIDILRYEFGVERPAFSFPFGIADEPLLATARWTKVTCGLRTTPTLVPVESDPFTWGRFGMSESDTAATLIVKLSGWYDALRRFARPIQAARPSTKQILAKRITTEGFPS